MDWEIGWATCVAVRAMGSLKRVLGQFMDNFILLLFFPEINNTWETGVCEPDIFRAAHQDTISEARWGRYCIEKTQKLGLKITRRNWGWIICSKKWGSEISLSEERLSMVFCIKNDDLEVGVRAWHEGEMESGCVTTLELTPFSKSPLQTWQPELVGNPLSSHSQTPAAPLWIQASLLGVALFYPSTWKTSTMQMSFFTRELSFGRGRGDWKRSNLVFYFPFMFHGLTSTNVFFFVLW